jgi:serine/threonine protein kinase
MLTKSMSSFSERYEFVRHLATGGMCDVSLARVRGEADFERDVVVKTLLGHLVDHPQVVRMFVDEARILSLLAHPSIPQVYDLAKTGNTWSIAMEYVEGVDLSAIVASFGVEPLPLPVALAIVTQIAEALHHAHERRDREGRALRIVHRDVTPQNILLTNDGVAKLLDFGIARTTLRDMSEPGVARGTFAYMSPEQVRGKALDKRSDVFGLGVILWELTTGERLFEGSDVAAMTRIVEQDAPSPSEYVEDYPEELERVIMHALRRSRSERLPSAAHFAALLDEFARKHGIAIGPRQLAQFLDGLAPVDVSGVHSTVETPLPLSEDLFDSEPPPPSSVWKSDIK